MFCRVIGINGGVIDLSLSINAQAPKDCQPQRMEAMEAKLHCLGFSAVNRLTRRASFRMESH
jgi:hypothetical protein